ncbi:MAG: OadG family protein [Nitrospinales bacterium]
MSNFTASLAISGIAMSAIFLILTLLIVIVKVLVAWWPYVAPPPTAADNRRPAQNAPNPEHVAAIHAALAQYLGKTPDDIRLQNIKPL